MKISRLKALILLFILIFILVIHEIYINVEQEELFYPKLQTTLCGFSKTDKNQVKCIKQSTTVSIGEDAAFYNQKSIIIADGVGSWAGMGVDPSHYSYEIVKYIDENQQFYNPEKETLREELKASYQHITNLGIPGSTTFVYVKLDENSNNLKILNLGDCQVAVFRKGKTVFKSVPQQYSFNFPYQLSAGTPFDDEEVSTPDDAEFSSFTLKRHDLIITGSDGVWDNIGEEELAVMTKVFTKESGHHQVTDLDCIEITSDILRYIRVRATDKKFCSPFCKRAKEAFDKKEIMFSWEGGKLDDTTLGITRVL